MKSATKRYLAKKAVLLHTGQSIDALMFGWPEHQVMDPVDVCHLCRTFFTHKTAPIGRVQSSL